MANQLIQVKAFLEDENLKKRFDSVLGKKANQFMSSILSAVSGNASLQECDPKSIISAALIAASLDLPIDSNLGFAAIVPYGSKDGKRAQFQIMAKGFIQLAIRTGQYSGMNYSEVYEDELLEYNPITKELRFNAKYKENGQREKGQADKIVGYYAWIQLASGFRQSIYMTVNEIKNHAKKYSASYKNDLSKGWNSSRWSTDFHVMALKTVIKLLLSKWGILSVDMQKAMVADQKVFNGDVTEYTDNPQEHIESAPTPIADPFVKPVPELPAPPEAKIETQTAPVNTEEDQKIIEENWR